MRFIFLDLDDTILDFHRAERQALSQTLRHFHVDPTDAVLDRYHVLNRRQWELLEEGKLTRPQVLVRRFQLLFDELGIRAAPQEVCQLYEEQLAQGHFFVPGAQELLEALHTRYELYLATNGTPEVQNSRIESAGIARYFQNIFISEQMGRDLAHHAPHFWSHVFRGLKILAHPVSQRHCLTDVYYISKAILVQINSRRIRKIF